MTDFVIYWLLVSVVHQINIFFKKKTCQILLSGQPHMLQNLCNSVRVKLLTRAKLIYLRKQPDDFFSVGNPEYHVFHANNTMTILYNKFK